MSEEIPHISLTLSMNRDLVDKLPTKWGERSKLIAELLDAHFRQQNKRAKYHGYPTSETV